MITANRAANSLILLSKRYGNPRMINQLSLCQFSQQIKDQQDQVEQKKDQQPVIKHYDIDENDIIGEQAMQRVKQSLQDKLKQVQEESKLDQENKGGHDAATFSFTQASALKDVHGGVYFHSKPMHFENGSLLIYKTNMDVYKTANMVDAFCSGIVVYSSYKACKHAYILANTMAWTSAAYGTLWGFFAFAQMRYLMSAYLQQVYLIDEIHLLDNLKQIKVRTVLHGATGYTNILASTRLKLMRNNKTIQSEYIIDIQDSTFSQRDQPDKSIMRLDLDGMKFFCHRNRTVHSNWPLLKAVFSDQVKEIKCLR